MPQTILVLAANPKKTPQLRLDQEVREIENGLERAQKRDDLILRQKWATRPVDVRRAMLDLEPNIVHFCGHGAGEEGIAFEGEDGVAKFINADALAGFFELFVDKVECVVLNACYSEIQAKAIAKHIPYVIGMKKAIGDPAAIEFSVAFYDALGAGKAIEFAYKLACNAIQWAGIPEHLTPALISKEHKAPSQPIEIDLKYRDQFFFWKKNFATSFRLFGAGNEFFPPKVVHVIPHKDVRYELPGKLLLIREEIINRLMEEARQRGTMFYDGPNTRLVDYYTTPVDKTEQKHIYMHFGPIGWYDYSVCEWALDHAVKQRTIDEIQEYLDLDEIANSQIIRNSKLTNILCTATTLITSDRFILYSQRGGRVSAIPGRFTSCIAENIHQEFDHSLEVALDNELPSPFKTALRGIEEEASPKIAHLVRSRPSLVFLLGLDFELLSFQPDLLFVVFIPFSYERFQEICRQHPGKDFIEGRIQAAPISPNRENLNEILSNPNWVPGGKASLIRALEFLDSIEEGNPNLQLEDLVRMLEEKNK